MSLVRDYHHYYCGTWIAQKEGELNLPIFVENIEDPSSFDSDDYSEEHRAQLNFSGIKYVQNNGNNRLVPVRVNIPVLDPSLELESPDVGYVLSGRDIRWTVIRPVRQRLKGMAGNKIHGASFSNGSSGAAARIIYDLFNPAFEGLVDRYTYVCPHTSVVHYKGAEIGTVNQETSTFVLLAAFEYVVRRLRLAYPNFTFETVEAL